MDADLLLINDLNESILRNPRAVQPLQLLVQIYSSHGMVTEAIETAKNLLEIDRDGLDRDTFNSLSADVRARVQRLQRERQSRPSPPSYSDHRRHTISNTSSQSRTHPSYPTPSRNAGFYPKHGLPDQMGAFQLGLSMGYGLRDYGNNDRDMYHEDRSSYRPPRNPFQRDTKSTGDVPRTKEKPTPILRLPPIQPVADRMASNPAKSLDIAIQDLASLISSSRQQDPKPSDDNLRSACVARTKELESILQPKYKHLSQQALMHITHEKLNPTYVNDETMVSVEPISTIPRNRFFVSEDNYAWDMSELVDALKANPAAALRNPLSRAPFTEADVTAIVQHPLGLGLAAMQVQQNELRKGVRKQTVDKMAVLARVLLEDEDSMEESREAMDDFAAYTATLPKQEKEALDALRVPAVDRHTGWGYDASLGEMLRDAKGNQVRFYDFEMDFPRLRIRVY